MRGRQSRPNRRALLLAGLVLLLASCSGASSDLLQPDSGGEGTTGAANIAAFDNSARNLTDEDRRVFEVGDSFFTQNWVTAPASTDKRDGLGPLLNARSCSSCHLRDGRGDPDGKSPGLLFRLSVPDGEGTAPEPTYGDQFQDRSILGVPAEGTVRTLYVEEEGNYADGTPYSLRRPVHQFEDLSYGELSLEVQVSPRLSPPVIGVGLLEAISEADIVAGADPDDADGDGISGRPNYVADLVTGGLSLGRFGWKANVPTVEQQVAHAFNGDIGITNPLLPDQPCTGPQVECAAAISGGEPEIDVELFEAVTFYNSTLAVPARRDLDNPEVIAGAGSFVEIGCASCHTPRHTTGAHAIEALANQVIFPFTDLLLHDMGPGLADGRPDGMASGSEWRTPPLWGLGLNDVVNGHTFFLHDGRARSIEEAVLWHGGEAAAAAEHFKELSAEQREALIAFLESL